MYGALFSRFFFRLSVGNDIIIIKLLSHWGGPPPVCVLAVYNIIYIYIRIVRGGNEMEEKKRFYASIKK